MSVECQCSKLQTSPNLVTIEVTRNHSERFRGECMRLIRENDKANKCMQDADCKQLDQRVRVVQFLKKELELKLDEIIVETDNLILLQIRVVRAQDACKDPLRVTILCLDERLTLPPSERMNDDVGVELLKEKDIIEEVVSCLQTVIEQITEQMRLNRSARYHLEQDLKEKYEALCIDKSCAIMTYHSMKEHDEFKFTDDLQRLTVTPKQWGKISDINIANAEQQKINSMSLRARVETLLEQMATNMRNQLQATSAAYQLNVQRIKALKNQMEEQLSKILPEFANHQRTREDLQVAITENEHYLSLAQARLDLRYQRPGKEHCHDPVQIQLHAEIAHLKAHIRRLREAMTQSEERQRILIRCQMELKKNIEIKDTSLYSNEVTCAQYREPIIIRTF